ncbi:MAG: aromatic ring-hydroxylating dioxygenase subunit alpha [Microcoleus sp. SIO2G3]|nr:aromatic ring-hydroxylating dioxygenase subunit alpha [Microcoleus sp. SIO2G3]
MFDLFPSFWTPILPAAEIENTPVAIELAGERLVLFRQPSGDIGALVDRCPHRSAALSLGRVRENGCLECPYHGWQFDRDGACTQIPLNNPAQLKLSQLSATSLPTQIIAGLVWIFTGQGEAPKLQLPESLMQSQDSYFIYHEVWNAHWTRLVENFMDYVHLPFVHRDSFGGAIGQPAIEAGRFVEFQIIKTEHSIQVFNRFDHPLDSGFALEWHQPNLVVLKFDQMGTPAPVRMHAFAIPINQHQTRYLIAMQLLEPYAAEIAHEFIEPVVEDRVVIESQEGAIPLTTRECNVPTDQATLLFRRWYYQMLNCQTAAV